MEYAQVVKSIKEMLFESGDPYEPEFNKDFAWMLENVPNFGLRFWNYLAKRATLQAWFLSPEERITVETPSKGPNRPDMKLTAGGHGFVCEHKVWNDTKGQVKRYADFFREPQWVIVHITVRKQQWAQDAHIKLLWSEIYLLVRDERDCAEGEWRNLLHLFGALVGRFRQPYDQLWPQKPKPYKCNRRYTKVNGWKIYIPEKQDIEDALAPVPAFLPTNPNAPTGADHVWENDLATSYHRVCAYAYEHRLQNWEDALEVMKPMIVEAWMKKNEIDRQYEVQIPSKCGQ